jgi:DNA polymerase I-like protein with 3'-5' exonuclease and polymerase domains
LWPGQKPKYYAFAHPNGGNTHTFSEARHALRAVWKSKRPVCCHNTKFDAYDVAIEHMKLPELASERVHDTNLMLFLQDPRRKTFKLKPCAAELLGEAPTERDAVIAWLVKHQPIPGVKLTATEPKNKRKVGASTAYAGAYTAYAPVPLVKRYACGDVLRARGLARKLLSELALRKMLAAYDVERFLLSPIHAMESGGVPVDLKRLRADVALYKAAFAKADAWLEAKTGAPVGTKWGSSATLLKWLRKAGLVDAAKLKKTKTGKDASNKDSLAGAVTCPQTLTVLKYRSRLSVSLRTFMEPWLAVAARSNGFIYTIWNTTRTDDNGARTGRLSSTPNFQNLPKRAPLLFGTAAEGANKAAPEWWIALGWPDLPNVRGYIVALPGHVLIDRDYSQQELRIFAHYADGLLLAKYLDDNWLDVHALVNRRVNELMGAEVSRDVVKRIVFAVIYGMGRPGIARLSDEYGIPSPYLVAIAEAVKKAVPGLIELSRKLRKRCDAKLPIRTWGGREYYVEEPRMVVDSNGKRTMRTFEYKMLNLLIQGSAADNTKRTILNLWAAIRRKHPSWRLLMTVHDEFVLSVPKADMAEAHRVLGKAMSSVKFDVPMLSEGQTGSNWGALVPYDKKGQLVYLAEMRKRKAARRALGDQKVRKAA